MTNSKKKKTWLAILLHLIVPGLGHIYYQNYIKGFLLHFILTLIAFIFIVLSVQFKLAVFIFLVLPFTTIIWLFGFFDILYNLSKGSTPNSFKSTHIYGLLIITVGLLAFDVEINTLAENNIYDINRVWNSSMESTIMDGDIIFISRISRKHINPGDIIVMISPKEPDKRYTKRCVAVENQKVEIRNGGIYVDDCLINFPSVTKSIDAVRNYTDIAFDSLQKKQDNMASLRIPKGHVFVMGDNRGHSFDSRFFGPVSVDKIIGKAVFIIYSTGMKPKEGANIFREVIEAISKTRWNRIGLKLR